MFYCVGLMKDNKKIMEEKQDKVRVMLIEFNGCQNDVVNIMMFVLKI